MWLRYQPDLPPQYYFEEIPELNVQERRGVLKRYATYKGLDLSSEDLRFFSDLLSGYPEQVLFAVDSISDILRTSAASLSGSPRGGVIAICLTFAP
ncbi:hypothetical protein Q6284_25695, partial [Klebsiella pneumoniae]